MLHFFQYIRYISFWIVDFFKGFKIKKHLQDINFILTKPNHPKAKSKRDLYLQNILKHAVNTTDFYKKNKNFNVLTDFEVINKNTIKNNFNSFKSKSFLNKKSFKVSTSGSSGVSLTVIQDKNKKNRNTADVIFFSKLVGYKIGYKLFYARHWDENYRKNKITLWFQNMVPIEVINLNKTAITSFISKIKKGNSNKSLIGYASAFELICKHLDKINSKPIKSGLKSIIAISETLNNYTKQKMLKYFGCKVVSRYSNMENGLIAQQTLSESNDFLINWASYYIEILDINEDIPVKDGEYGRIVVTDLFNYAMPIIRYDTGDLGIIDKSKSPPVLKKIEGRKMDILLNTKGEIITSFVLIVLYDFEGINQYQLIQEDQKHYILKLKVDNNFNRKNEIINIFKRYLGSDALIDIVYVDSIPLLKSGKRKTVINNYINF